MPVTNTLRGSAASITSRTGRPGIQISVSRLGWVPIDNRRNADRRSRYSHCGDYSGGMMDSVSARRGFIADQPTRRHESEVGWNKRPRPSLQLRVLGLGLLQDGEVRVCVVSELK